MICVTITAKSLPSMTRWRLRKEETEGEAEERCTKEAEEEEENTNKSWSEGSEKSWSKQKQNRAES